MPLLEYGSRDDLPACPERNQQSAEMNVLPLCRFLFFLFLQVMDSGRVSAIHWTIGPAYNNRSHVNFEDSKRKMSSVEIVSYSRRGTGSRHYQIIRALA